MNEQKVAQKVELITELEKLVQNVKNDKFDEQHIFDIYPFIKVWNNLQEGENFNIDESVRLLYLGYYVDELYKKLK